MQSETLPQSFLNKKAHILSQLAIPASSYDDLSPKGSIDEGIRDLIDEINGLEGYVTTSSCAGRICVFLEGKKSQEIGNLEEREEGEREDVTETTTAGIGGKGGGGKWLFVSHDEIVVDETLQIVEGINGRRELLGMEAFEGNEEFVRDCMGKGDCRLIHLKFEPMILHILTSSPSTAHTLLSHALQSGFRESGALSIFQPSTTVNPSLTPSPIVAIRTIGLHFSSLIGIESQGRLYTILPFEQLRFLFEIANKRFAENEKRRERFRGLLMGLDGKIKKGKDGGEWEDRGVRRERLKAEGLRRREEMRKGKEASEKPESEGLDADGLANLGLIT